MFQIIVPLLAGLSVFLIGGAVMLARNARRAKLAARLSTSGGGEVTGTPEPGVVRFVTSLGKLTLHGKNSRTISEELARAGFHSKNAAATYLGAKLLLFACGLTLALALVSALNMSPRNGIVLTVAIASVFFYLPNVGVSIRRKERLQAIVSHLPDAIDLLEISVTAGMGLDQAWNAVTDEVRDVCTPLADEMALTNLEIHLGASRPAAMRHMAERTGALDLGSLVACLVQSERFGTSVQDALRNFALAMRETRSQRAQEVAEKMPVKMIFPMLLIFISSILVMVGPAALVLTKSLASSAANH